MKEIEYYERINKIFSVALSSIARNINGIPYVIARKALDSAVSQSLEYEKLVGEEYAWKVIDRTIKNRNRLCRQDIVNGEIVQLCESLKFYASIYEEETSKILIRAHDLICAFVNADCLMKIFDSEKLLKKYEEMKTLDRQLANRATRCTNREKKIENKLKKLEMANY